MRPLSIALLGITLALPAVADEKPLQGRYAVEPSADGFIRLDTETGAISHCTRRDNGVWHCDVIADDTTALAKRLDALTAEVSALRKELDALRAPPAPPPPVTEAPPPAPGASVGFADTLMHRLFTMVREIKEASR